MPEGQRPRGVTPRPRSGAAAESARLQQHRTTEKSYPVSEARGSGLECQAETAQEQLRGAHPHPRPGVAAGRSYHPPEARGSGREELPHARGQGWQPREATPLPRSSGYASSGGPRGATPSLRSGGGGEKIPLVQGKEQRLCFAGAALKRYPTSNVRATQVRW